MILKTKNEKRKRGLLPVESQPSILRRDIGCVPIVIAFALLIFLVAAIFPSNASTDKTSLVPTSAPSPGNTSLSDTEAPTSTLDGTSIPDDTSTPDELSAIQTDLSTDNTLPKIQDITLESSLLTISYLSKAKNQQQINDEWLRLIDAVAASLLQHDILLDQVALNSSTDDPSPGGSILVVSYKNVVAYHNKQMTRTQLLNNVSYSAHNPTDVPATKDRTATAESHSATLQVRYDNLTSTAYYAPLPTSIPYSAPPANNDNSCPHSCADCVAKGWTAQQCAQCPNLDRDHDGLACYGT